MFKQILCLFLIATVAFSGSVAEEAFTRYIKKQTSFFHKTWTVSKTSSPDLTKYEGCVPTGTVKFSPASGNAYRIKMKSSTWEGKLCKEWNYKPDHEIFVPFVSTSTYNQTAEHGVIPDGAGAFYQVSGLASTAIPNKKAFNVSFVFGKADGEAENMVKITMVTEIASTREVEPYFFDGSWFIVSPYSHLDLQKVYCCMPYESAKFYANSAETRFDMTGGSMVGEICNYYRNAYDLPIIKASTFEEIASLGPQTLPQDTYKAQVSVQNFKSNIILPDGSINESFEFVMSFNIFGATTCSVTMIRKTGQVDNSAEFKATSS